MGVLDAETLFSRKWGFGALPGVGGIPIRHIKGYIRFRARNEIAPSRQASLLTLEICGFNTQLHCVQNSVKSCFGNLVTIMFRQKTP